MTWLYRFLTGLVVGFGILSFVVWRGSNESARILVDFVAQIESATVRRPNDDVFAAATVTLAGETRQAIAVAQASRIAWDVVPADGQWLEVDVAVREDGWSSPANAVLFRVGLSYNGQYEDLIAQTVAPASSPGDRGWIPVRLDLSPYTGRAISLIFNTAAAPGVPEGHEHHAVWGAPVLVQR